MKISKNIGQFTSILAVVTCSNLFGNLAHSSCYKMIKDMEFSKDQSIVLYSTRNSLPLQSPTLLSNLEFNKTIIGHGRTGASSEPISGKSLLTEMIKNYSYQALSSYIPYEKVLPQFALNAGKGIHQVYDAVTIALEKRDHSDPKKISTLLEDAQTYIDSKKAHSSAITASEMVGPSLDLFFKTTNEISGLSMDETANLLLDSNLLEFICGNVKIEDTHDLYQFQYDNFDNIVKKISTGRLQKLLGYKMPPKKESSSSSEGQEELSSNENSWINWGLGLASSAYNKAAYVATMPIRAVGTVCNAASKAIDTATDVAYFAKNVYDVLYSADKKEESSQAQPPSQSSSLPLPPSSPPRSEEEVIAPTVIDVSQVRVKAINNLMAEADETAKIREECQGCLAEYYSQLFKKFKPKTESDRSKI